MRRIAALLLFAFAVAGSGCSESSKTLAPIVRPTGPAPSSPAGVIRLFEWCWENRAIDEYETIFTDDFRFLFATGDSAGNAYRDAPWTREDELACARRLFVGDTDHAPASDIQLDFDRTLIALNDDRPGKDPGWHRSIRTKVNLKVTIDRGAGPEVNEVNGYAKFYVVRGDSAAIPPELAARGFQPDPNRWWIERWEDETLPPGGTAVAPVVESSSVTRRGSRPAAANPAPNPIYVESTFGRVKLKGL